MPVKSSKSVSLETKVRQKITYLRAPLATLAALAVLSLIHQPAFFWAGAVVSLCGEALQIWAASHLHKDRKFTVSGPYAHVRNPMYLGRFFLILGFFLMTANPFLIVAYVIAFSLYAQGRVRREESRLQRIFKPHYQHFCLEVRRWLPRLRPYSRAEARRASWAQVCSNGEQLNLMGTVIVLIAIYLLCIERVPLSFVALALMAALLVLLPITRVTTNGTTVKVYVESSQEAKEWACFAGGVLALCGLMFFLG